MFFISKAGVGQYEILKGYIECDVECRVRLIII